MSKKPKKSRRSPSSRKIQAKALSPEAQEQHVRSLLAAGKYKEASESCKILLKLESRPEWLELLATIYSGRAKELAAKGMYKEAVMIWRNRAELCGQPLADVFYFRMLIEAGMAEQALDLYQQHQADFEQQGLLAEVRECMAAFSLTQPSDFIKPLPVDDAIAKDYPVAMAALQAYCNADDAQMQEQLAGISFRSPFRDLRQILKALSVKQDDVTASKLLARMSADSPFKPLAEATLLSMLPDNQLIADISTLNVELMQFIAARKGLDDKLSIFLNELFQLGKTPTAEQLMRFLLRHQATLGKNYTRETALRLLPHTSRALPMYVKAFGGISGFQRNRVEALAVENKKSHPMHIFDTWDDAEDELARSDCDSKEDYQLTRALIGCHKLEQLDRLGDCERMAVVELTRIVENDPQDKASFLRLIAAHREMGELKPARATLEQAQKNFPDDISLLTEAVEVALASNAYKKAAALAAQILDKDPINTRVRGSLIDAHLSHTRKLIKQHKHALAEKELAIADSWTRTEKDKARVDLVRGVLLLDLRQPEKAAAIWNASIQILGGELCGHFYLLVELLDQDRSVDTVLKKTKIKKITKPTSKTSLLDFLNLLKAHYFKTEADEVFAAIEPLTTAISHGIKFNYTVAEFDLICTVSIHFEWLELIAKYATKAHRQYPEEIAFEYYIIFAKSESLEHLSNRELNRLGAIRELAFQKGDNGLLYRVETLINEYDFPFFPAPSFEDDDEDDDDEFPSMEELGNMQEMDAAIDMFLKLIPPGELKKMGKELNESDPREIAKAIIMQDLQGLVGNVFDDDDDDDDFDPFEPQPSAKKKKARKKEKPNKQMDLF